MNLMRRDFIENIYAGWLAKIIGIRLGAPVEGWTYEQIKNVYGPLDGYAVDYKDFAADDDSNGPLFFLRALEDSGRGSHMEAQDVAEALLNYAPFEHGFFWWGGYGTSTEHTAYLNLRNGIPAPRSGSIAQNGSTVAEQIGGQIFIDTWGLVTPGNPDLAAALAGKAASVTHDGNGIYGGIFVAVCISYAFVEKDIHKIIAKGLSYLPEDCDYARIVNTVLQFHAAHPGCWEDCYRFIYENHGYDKYPGNCHIIPNTAVMILALLYGNGSFTDTLNICNRCGWDTDCNVGNVATIMGVRNGLAAIDASQWRAPVNDLLICSSVVGSLNMMDIPYGAAYIVKLAAMLAGKSLPEPYDRIISQRMDSCHFEFPGSTHAMRVRSGKPLEYTLINTDESAATGSRSLKVTVNRMQPGENVFIYKKTYYRPSDFHDSRYDPSFSPLVYPGQTLHGSVMVPSYGPDVCVSLYAREMHTGRIYESTPIPLEKGCWLTLEYRIPSIQGGLVDEMGFCAHVRGERNREMTMVLLMDDLYANGHPCYSIEMDRECEEVWTPMHREITQFTRLKGLAYLADGQLELSACDFGEVYTGGYNWTDYQADFYMTPVLGDEHRVNVRVQGAIRSYAAALLPGGRLGLLKNENGYRILAETAFAWEHGQEYKISVRVKGDMLTVAVDDCTRLSFQDTDSPYMEGAIGISVQNGSHCRCRKIEIA